MKIYVPRNGKIGLEDYVKRRKRIMEVNHAQK